MIKKKGIILGLVSLMVFSPVVGYGGKMSMGTSVLPFMDGKHITPACEDAATALLAVNNYVLTMWIDPGMAVATGVDWLATKKHDERTIDAADAISELKEALGNDDSESSTDSSTTSQNASLATVYTADSISAQIELGATTGGVLFEKVREAVREYLLANSDPVIKAGCTQSDRDCATNRQNEWLLASVSMASATADKVLDQTASTKNKKTPLVAHFEELKSSFNAETSPIGLYNKMADIVLDTHRQINDANALMGRDLEAQGLLVVAETGPVLLDGAETED